jgi:hypothetical protein
MKRHRRSKLERAAAFGQKRRSEVAQGWRLKRARLRAINVAQNRSAEPAIQDRQSVEALVGVVGKDAMNSTRITLESITVWIQSGDWSSERLSCMHARRAFESRRASSRCATALARTPTGRVWRRPGRAAMHAPTTLRVVDDA